MMRLRCCKRVSQPSFQLHTNPWGWGGVGKEQSGRGRRRVGSRGSARGGEKHMGTETVPGAESWSRLLFQQLRDPARHISMTGTGCFSVFQKATTHVKPSAGLVWRVTGQPSRSCLSVPAQQHSNITLSSVNEPKIISHFACMFF